MNIMERKRRNYSFLVEIMLFINRGLWKMRKKEEVEEVEMESYVTGHGRIKRRNHNKRMLFLLLPYFLWELHFAIFGSILV